MLLSQTAIKANDLHITNMKAIIRQDLNYRRLHTFPTASVSSTGVREQNMSGTSATDTTTNETSQRTVQAAKLKRRELVSSVCTYGRGY